jgi:hypothetical protein
MDEMIYRAIDDSDRRGDGDLAALFAELDRVQGAPIELGLQKLCRAIADRRRRDGLGRD